MFDAGRGGFELLFCVFGFIAAFAIALGPIPWIVCSEIFPAKVRGRAMSVATFTIWTSCLIVTLTCPPLIDKWIGPAATFWIYTGCSAAALVFVSCMLPETKGRSLEEIERSWRREP